MDKRIELLETTITFQEEALERLSQELRKQQQEINKLKDDLTSLQNFLHENALTSEGADQKPPHY